MKKYAILMLSAALLYSCESTNIDDVPIQEEIFDESSSIEQDLASQSSEIENSIINENIEEITPEKIIAEEIVVEEKPTIAEEIFDVSTDDILVQETGEVDVLTEVPPSSVIITDDVPSLDSFTLDAILPDEDVILENDGAYDVGAAGDDIVTVEDTESAITDFLEVESFENANTIEIPLTPLTQAIPVGEGEEDEVLPQLENLENENIDTQVVTEEQDVAAAASLSEDVQSNDVIIASDTVILDDSISQDTGANTDDVVIVAPSLGNETQISEASQDETDVLSLQNTDSSLLQDSFPTDSVIEPLSELDTITINQDGNMVIPESQTEIEEDSIEMPSAPDVIVLPPGEELPEELPELIIPSQKLEVIEGDYVDIVLPGQGWIFLGEVHETNPPVVTFYARFVDGDDTLFNFYAEKEGSTILHFYKQDILANEYLDEYLEVSISPQRRASAVRPSAVTKTEDMFGISSEPEVVLGGETEIVQEEFYIDEFSPESILEEAELAYAEGRYQDSIYLLDEYTSLGVNEIDRALFLYGKNYESTSDVRNIRLSHSSYKKILESFPDSTYWDEANKRVIYLERFYLTIR